MESQSLKKQLVDFFSKKKLDELIFKRKLVDVVSMGFFFSLLLFLSFFFLSFCHNLIKSYLFSF